MSLVKVASLKVKLSICDMLYTLMKEYDSKTFACKLDLFDRKMVYDDTVAHHARISKKTCYLCKR